MATKAFKALTEQDLHTVGNIVSPSKQVFDVPNGALFTADTDNFTLVELGFDEEGNRTAKPLTVATKKGYLVAAPELRYLGEGIGEFYVGAGERGRIVRLTDGLIIDSSAFILNGVAEVKAGQSAHFDVTTRKFIVHDGSHADFATAYDKFTVTANEADLRYNLGQATVRLEVAK